MELYEIKLIDILEAGFQSDILRSKRNYLIENQLNSISFSSRLEIIYEDEKEEKVSNIKIKKFLKILSSKNEKLLKDLIEKKYFKILRVGLLEILY
jgi:hypothetical protein